MPRTPGGQRCLGATGTASRAVPEHCNDATASTGRRQPRDW